MSTILIDGDGTMRFVYNDDLKGLMDEGSPDIRRASHVEPTANGKWVADLTPVCGPTLGPFELRSQALTAEIAWIEQYVIKEGYPAVRAGIIKRIKGIQ